MALQEMPSESSSKNSLRRRTSLFLGEGKGGGQILNNSFFEFTGHQ